MQQTLSPLRYRHSISIWHLPDQLVSKNRGPVMIGKKRIHLSNDIHDIKILELIRRPFWICPGTIQKNSPDPAVDFCIVEYDPFYLVGGSHSKILMIVCSIMSLSLLTEKD